MKNNNENKNVIGSLVGVNGNAFSLMAHFKNLARRQGFENERIKSELDKAMNSAYNSNF